MFGRAMTLLALCLTAVPAFAQTQPFAYTAGTQRYRISISYNNQRDQNGGRAPAQFDYTATQVVTVNLAAKARDTLTLTVTVDSIGIESALDAPRPDLSWEKGVKMVGTVSPTGRIYAFAPPADVDANTRGLYAGFRRFLPLLRTPVGIGSSWADTSIEQAGRRGPFDSVRTQTVILARVTGDTTYAGQRALRIERAGSVALNGAGQEGGRALKVTGDGTIRGVQYVNAAGIFLGSRSTQTIRIVESFPETGDGPASTQVIRSEIEPLPPVRTASQ